MSHLKSLNLRLLALVSILFISHNAQTKTYQQLFLEADQEFSLLEGKKCVKMVQEALKTGLDFKILELKEYVHPILEENFSSRRSDLLFYHYTNNGQAAMNAEENTPNKQFDFLRTKPDHSWFVAEDPKSSKAYGQNQIRVHLKSDKLILPGRHTKVAYEIISHFIWKNFGDTCPQSKVSYFRETFLPLLVLELNDISLIDYYQSQKWYRVMSEDAIEKIEKGRPGRW